MISKEDTGVNAKRISARLLPLVWIQTQHIILRPDVMLFEIVEMDYPEVMAYTSTARSSRHPARSTSVAGQNEPRQHAITRSRTSNDAQNKMKAEALISS